MRILFCLLLFWATPVLAQYSVEKQLREQVYVKVELSKRSSVVGDPIMATYSLYTRLQSESKVVKRPGFKGFGVYDMVPPESGISTSTTVNGEAFSVYVLRKVQLYPMQSGKLFLEPMEVENDVLFNGRSYSFSSKTEEITIQVVDLPKTDRKTFNGAVGSFSISAAVLNKGTLHEHDLLELAVTIKGKGNFPVLAAPEIRWPAEVEAYSPNITEQISKEVMPIIGSKRFVFPFMVKQKGKISIPAISFSYYDASENRFVDLQTEEIELSIAAAVKAKSAPLVSSPPSHTNKLFIALGAIILLMIIAFVILRKKKKLPIEALPVYTPDYNWKDDILPIMQQALKQKQAQLFYQKLNEGLDKWLYYRFGIVYMGEVVNLENNASAAHFKVLKDRAALVLYTPYDGSEHMESDYTLFIGLIQ